MRDRFERDMGDSRRGFYPRGGPVAPVREGDEIEVTIEAVGAKGDGIAKKDGFVIFVPNTQVQDKVKIRITRVLRRVGFGEVIGKAGESAEAPAEAPAEGEESAEEETPTEEGAPKEEPAEKKVQDEEFFEGHEDTEDFGEETEEEKK